MHNNSVRNYLISTFEAILLGYIHKEISATVRYFASVRIHNGRAVYAWCSLHVYSYSLSISKAQFLRPWHDIQLCLGIKDVQMFFLPHIPRSCKKIHAMLACIYSCNYNILKYHIVCGGFPTSLSLKTATVYSRNLYYHLQLLTNCRGR